MASRMFKNLFPCQPRLSAWAVAFLLLAIPGTASAVAPAWHNDAFTDTLVNGNLCTTDGTIINCNISQVSPSLLGIGTASSSTFLRGDGTWATPAANLSGGSAGYGAVWGSANSLTYDSAELPSSSKW